MLFDSIKGVLNENRIVCEYCDLVAVRECRLNLVKPLLHFLCNSDGVLSRLSCDNKGDCRRSVEVRLRSRFFGAVFDKSEIVDLDLVTTSVCHNDVSEVIDCLHLAKGSQTGLDRPFIQSSTGELEVLHPDRSRNLTCRDVVGAHEIRIDPDIHLTLLTSDDRHLPDAADRFDSFLDLLLGDLCDVLRTSGTGNDESENRSGIRIELLDSRCFSGLGEIWNHRLNPVLNLLGRYVHVLLEHELHENL